MREADPGAADELLQRVQALVPELAAQATEAERLRRPTDAQIHSLEEAGVFRLMVPRIHGGLELDLDTFVEVGLALARADVSIAWVATFCIEHNWMFCQFPESFQKSLYAGADWILAPGTIAPNGQARREAGGYRLSGRWAWGTGVMHASWAIIGAVTDTDEGPASWRCLALPMADVKVEDTWFVDGMVGTGSNDMVVADAFVPEERSVSILAMVEGRAHGATLHAGPLYRTPMIPILMLAASMPIVGHARVVVESPERSGARPTSASTRCRTSPTRRTTSRSRACASTTWTRDRPISRSKARANPSGREGRGARGSRREAAAAPTPTAVDSGSRALSSVG